MAKFSAIFTALMAAATANAACTPANGRACGAALLAQGAGCATPITLAFITPAGWSQADSVYPIVNGDPNVPTVQCPPGRCRNGACF